MEAILIDSFFFCSEFKFRYRKIIINIIKNIFN